MKPGKVKNFPNWERKVGGELINSDVNSFKQHQQQKRIMETKEAKIVSLTSDINIITDKLDKLESMMLKFLEKGSNGTTNSRTS